MTAAYSKEQSKPAKDAMLQILTSSKLSALGKRPLCQDTGIVTIFVEVGMDVEFEGDQTIDDLINQGVAEAYLNPENPLRASIVEDPLGLRKNTKNNTPAVIHTRLVKGRSIDFKIAAKGGGSENKAHLKMMNPSDDLVGYILDSNSHFRRRLVSARCSRNRCRRHCRKSCDYGERIFNGIH